MEAMVFMRVPGEAAEAPSAVNSALQAVCFAVLFSAATDRISASRVSGSQEAR
jgi:hypothetical protein